MAKDVTGQDDDCKPNWDEISATGFSPLIKREKEGSFGVILEAKPKL